MSEIIAKIDLKEFIEAIRQIVREEVRDGIGMHLKLNPSQDAAIKLLTMMETCSYLRLSRGTVNKLIKNGGLDSIKVGNKRMFEINAIEKYLNNNKTI